MEQQFSKSLDPKLISQLKLELEQKKEHLERELSAFATKDPNLKGDWDTRYPRVPEGNLEEAADEVEEYSTKLNIEFNLENQLKDVNDALLKIERGGYGICENCKKPIEEARLRAFPEARLCNTCLAQKK